MRSRGSTGFAGWNMDLSEAVILAVATWCQEVFSIFSGIFVRILTILGSFRIFLFNLREEEIRADV